MKYLEIFASMTFHQQAILWRFTCVYALFECFIKLQQIEGQHWGNQHCAVCNLQNTNRSILIIFYCLKKAAKWKPVKQQGLERLSKWLFSHNCMKTTSCYSIFSILVLLFHFFFSLLEIIFQIILQKPSKSRYFSSQKVFPAILYSFSFLNRVVTKIFTAL